MAEPTLSEVLTRKEKKEAALKIVDGLARQGSDILKQKEKDGITDAFEIVDHLVREAGKEIVGGGVAEALKRLCIKVGVATTDPVGIVLASWLVEVWSDF